MYVCTWKEGGGETDMHGEADGHTVLRFLRAFRKIVKSDKLISPSLPVRMEQLDSH